MTVNREWRDTPRPWVLYRLFDADGALLYIGISSRLKQRLTEHRSSGVSDMASHAVEPLGAITFAEAARFEQAAIKAERPPRNRQGNPDYHEKSQVVDSAGFWAMKARLEGAA